MENALRVTAHLTEKDFLQFNFYILFRRRLAVRILLLGTFLFLIVTAAQLLSGNVDSDRTLILICIALLAYWTLVPAIVYVRASKAYRTSKFKVEELHYEFSPEGYTLENKILSSKLSWNAVYAVAETKSWFLVFQNSRSAHILPKRDFSPEQERALKGLFIRLPIRNKKLL